MKISFGVDEDAKEYSDLILGSIEYVGELFGFNYELKEDPLIKVYEWDGNPAELGGSYLKDTRGALGYSSRKEIHLRDLVFNPFPYFKGKKELLEDYIVQEGVNKVFTHEFMEVMVRLGDTRKDLNPHFMISHLFGDVKCLNNLHNLKIDLPEDLTLEQEIILINKERYPKPCEYHLEMIKRYLLVLSSEK